MPRVPRFFLGLLCASLLIVGCATDTAEEADRDGVPMDDPGEPIEQIEGEGTVPLIDIPNAVMPFDDLLIGGQPTQDDLRLAAEEGYTTVVNLRPDDELPEWYTRSFIEDELGLHYYRIPVADANDVTEENAEELAAIVDEPDLFPVLMHCSSGNRVGALFAARAYFLAGDEVEQALEVGRTSGLTELEEPLREQWSANRND
ncbi:MAG: hypothetical protein GVY12_18225 [Bacteroidetes bacterium]|jgi:uncharacterized protein (TIGR01244 family)|nr:hypothetical protein [Bacteroidota bacterium]